MVRLFGTDGVRGVANIDLTAEQALSLASAAVEVLAGPNRTSGPSGRGKPVVVVGRDTRPSGEFLEAAVVAGLAASGADVARIGVAPTPAVAHAVAASGAMFGVMLSASHNPMPDNGIKLFAAGGLKLPDEVEDAIERRMALPPSRRPVGADVGRVRDEPVLLDRYAAHLLATLPVPLDGLRVVVDCAQGAASTLAPRVLRAAGADVVALHADGDGIAINDGSGATHLDSLRAAVVAHGADVGIAHDGDADRCLAVDATGEVVDGDQILAMCALALAERGELVDDTVVVTVMSNLGFHHAMREAGITVVTTPVGDRYVLETMRAGGYVLGGEQSGHVVFLDHATTGDGLLTALRILGRVAETGQPLGELTKAMTRLPQVLVNVRGVDRTQVDTNEELLRAVALAKAELGDEGRVLLRSSGTEPLVRVMVEAGTDAAARAVAQRLAAVVRTALPPAR
ncbi:phosphoglucosamine mutase [Frankia casuarinae]|uniref:Phosphoglucosamine mutase n=1 Tax=Frankia casuarinae (strain DSM 45818 / CECT 9043 / HFP020203 / CcI3) TaxID=106370 RepID=GLMM_FRACC|nr:MULTISPECIES: phosphoglucosamine mutase [Frankia]Q2JFE2.1 RecName: Full=Phosphoglucosamine mutase [Frankia casuarinae]ABD10000.1 phosphoglucosamine mutase [Frankia casuarinae]ETA04290.1 phosphoglucosamine mutase [Frankia sp. CcI6]EYT92209.1 phosphoglucosamine mutase [Frankia casuarinae]KDA45036.1 phosphoglucosamine mutase [Frankia sp. BMG5.23]KFB06662.1 phosphoglucosamine mutase [Frankia sp. Allo2]